jgi:hypothetical protein
MSLTKTAQLYEKMLQNPENRKRSFVRQPMPGDEELGGVKPPVDEAAGISEEDDAWIRDVDKRVANKGSKGASATAAAPSNISEAKRIKKLEEEVAELKELMTTIMKQHLKLIGK